MQTQTLKQDLLKDQILATINKHATDIVMYFERAEMMIMGDQAPNPSVKQNKMSLEIQNDLDTTFDALEFQLTVYERQAKDKTVNTNENMFATIFNKLLCEWYLPRLNIPYTQVDYYCLQFADSMLPFANNEKAIEIYHMLKKKVADNNGKPQIRDQVLQIPMTENPEISKLFNAQSNIMQLQNDVRNGQQQLDLPSWKAIERPDLT